MLKPGSRPARSHATDTTHQRLRGQRAAQVARRSAAALSVRMPHWQLRAIYVAATGLILSGVLWLLLHYFARIDQGFGLGPNPLEHPLLALHGATAMVFLIVLGTLLPVHIPRGWAQRRNLRSGLSMLSVNLVLIVTGYGLYYLGGDRARAADSTVHWLLGLSVGVLLVWHIVAGRRHAASR